MFEIRGILRTYGLVVHLDFYNINLNKLIKTDPKKIRPAPEF